MLFLVFLLRELFCAPSGGCNERAGVGAVPQEPRSQQGCESNEQKAGTPEIYSIRCRRPGSNRGGEAKTFEVEVSRRRGGR